MSESNGHGDGLVRLDPRKVERLMVRLGLSKAALAEAADVSRNTVYRVFRRDGIRRSCASGIANALRLDDLVGLLPNSLGDELSGPGGPGSPGNEWEVEGWVSPWITASNGLQYRVCRLRHRLLTERHGRGKCYDLQHQSTALQEQLRAHLLRHPTVCERIGPHPHLADNLSVAPGDRPGLWWVVDRGVEGAPLQERLQSGPYPADALPRLMAEIAEGLDALHAKKIIFRELAPSRILVEEPTGRIVLTDFELAKLLDGATTVSADWPDDPYRAPEVATGAANVRADLYSWARVLVHAAVGHLPELGEDVTALKGVDLPRGIRTLAGDCLSPAPSDRPKNTSALLRALRRWK